jgi:copper chaperone CopZ
MTQTINITGMTCEACEYKIKHVLGQIDGVTNVETNLKTGDTTLETNRKIPIDELQTVLKPHSKYKLGIQLDSLPLVGISNSDETEPWILNPQNIPSWLETYKPILLIFGYITVVSVVASYPPAPKGGLFVSNSGGSFMSHFMAGFFLVFSFFKMLNLKGFAESYAMYDVVAKRVPAWGYVYAFIELGLGLAYLTGFEPTLTNGITFVVMSVSIVGVLVSVLNKQKIQCACLGAVFKLPMSTVTIIEDALMIAMSGAMLLMG